MRRLAIVLAASLLMGGVYTPDIGPGPLGQDQSGGWKLLWWSKLDRNGIDDEDSLPSGFPTPEIAWFGWDPLVNHGSDGGTFSVEDGATAAAYSPFCPDGDFSDMTDSGTPAANSCLQARYFDGNDSYVSTDLTLGNPGTSDYSICAIYAVTSTASVGIAGCRDSVSTHGVYMWSGTYSPNFSWFHSVAHQSEAITKPGINSWQIVCGSGDIDGNIMVLSNGDTAGGVTASTAGDLDAGSSGFSIGEIHGSNRFVGNILAVYAWTDTALTAAQIKQFTQFWYGLLPMGEYAMDTATTAGTACQWMGQTTSKMMCLTDDAPLVGGVISPGLTGAGSGGGMYNINSLTNVALQSRDPSATWAETGTLIGATSTANSPFWDNVNYPVTLLEDNDGAGVEYMAQGIDMTALATGSKVTIVVYARGGTGTKGFDIRLYEQTGAACTAAQTDYDAIEITTSWKTIVYTYTITDGDCEAFVIYTGPVSAGGAAHDFADVAETGDMYALYQVFFGNGAVLTNTSQPMVYIETTVAAASGGDTRFQWLNNSNLTGLQDSSASKSKIEATVTPGYAFASAPNGNIFWVHNGAYTVYHRAAHISGSPQTVQWRTNAGTNTSTIANPGWAGGTSTTIMLTLDWGADIYKIYQDNTLKDTDSLAEAPGVGVDSLDIGYAAANGGGPGHWVKNFKFWRKK